MKQVATAYSFLGVKMTDGWTNEAAIWAELSVGSMPWLGETYNVWQAFR